MARPTEGGPRPEREDRGAYRGGSPPPPRSDPVAIAEPGRPHRGSRSDVGGQHRGKEEPRSQPAAGDKEVGGLARASTDPEAEPDEQGGIADEQDEVQIHAKAARVVVGRPLER